MKIKYDVYIDNETGKTLFFNKEQKKRINYVGIFYIEEKEKNYLRYNGRELVLDNLLYQEFLKKDLDESKKVLTIITIEKYNESIFNLKKNYPSEEVTGWDYKSIQAKLWTDTKEDKEKQKLIDNKSVIMLVNESDGTIEAINKLATRIITNSNNYQEIYGKNTKKYKELVKKISDSKTIEELNKIKEEIIYD